MTDPGTATSGYERSFRTVSSMANLDNEIAYYVSGTIVLALDVETFYKYSGASWEEYDWPNSMTGGVILLYRANGDPIEEYAFDATGFDAALAAFTAGDAICVPTGTLAGNHTLVAGANIIGMGRKVTYFLGTITGASNASIKNCSICPAANAETILNGVQMVVNGNLYLDHVDITPIQSGSGNLNSVYVSSGDVYCQDCILDGRNVTTGTGYAGYLTESSTGNLYIYGGAAYGSDPNSPFNV